MTGLSSRPPAADARQQIERDMSFSLTLSAAAHQNFLRDYPDKISEIAARFPDPDAAYTALSNHADDFYEQLVEKAEIA
ncbi:hypothetical protein OG728_39385 (plasmid) [Streptomyces microflavus]|uniref:hypothetical protein n=1 Tax=Streptomyces microflavus TaxID=1919 RepID=UPI002E12A3C5|nr:hypothetical protein OG728_39385 [Streptomyces microflavus]